MQSAARQRQRHIDAACGYALGGYLGLTLTWVSLITLPAFGLYGWLMAAVAGFFGLLRSITLPARFRVILGVELIACVLVAVVFMAYNAPLMVVGMGMLFSAGFAYPVVRLFRNDFAKPPPAWLCKDCGYALFGLETDRCPECGRAFDPDRVPALDHKKT